ncbi:MULTISPECIES: hypothetical protein [unclassified Microcoleus]|uniref:hypothetical protein n=1 Tax=unclassified Microcoleus TaxID=2642155 RepID=UPI001D705F0C|nr:MULTISPECIES: hypothetical protein [unclassified Microcoleus]MCC3443356.1 hypothetical protein [Microcoleus sp. PH2017_03_ELD_O_A]MCC3470144.1 hypothetical protein [Microcoleus sp. PH2017_06_SFM_O_A]MCC3547062.1 hypothetical protein [Microcoleus sp. PH2017_24_DOB_U_A]MCC3566256.1 hypothetical protein [Microcoleus sp. PH2017_31_RDM_U_A]MCC3475485.1 hypothetical protein [Microcoleus sp. PH2017_13_LAR_U_A]
MINLLRDSLMQLDLRLEIPANLNWIIHRGECKCSPFLHSVNPTQIPNFTGEHYRPQFVFDFSRQIRDRLCQMLFGKFSAINLLVVMT